MPDDAEIRKALQGRKGWTRQNTHYHISTLEKKIGSPTYALYILAYESGVKLKRHGVDDDTLLKVAELSAARSAESANGAAARNPPNSRNRGSTQRGKTTAKRKVSKVATVMFTDIVDSTAIATKLGNAKWSQLRSEHNALCADLVKRRHGHVVKNTGDGVLATFSSPAQAVRCGFEICEGVRKLGVAVRVGLHTTEIIYQDGDIEGVGVNIASRIMAKANPGEVLVSGTVKGIVTGSRLVFDSRGVHRLKGVEETWELFAARV